MLLAIPTRERLERVLRYVFDEAEFLSPHGVRSLSRTYLDHPYSIAIGGETYRVEYEPAESRSWIFGGNSNWRGPVWFPINYLLIEALQRYHHFYGDSFTMEFPTGSGRRLTLDQIARELARRLTALFLPDAKGKRPAPGGWGLNPPTTIVNPPTTDRTILIGGVVDNPPTSFIFLVTPPLQGLTPPNKY